MRGFALAPLLILGACSQNDAPAPVQAERIELAKAGGGAPSSEPLASPDTSNSAWTVDENGQAIHFGPRDTETTGPWLTLDCRLNETPPEMRIIRHAPTRPGMKALFPVQGNGVRSRFLADAKLSDGEWRWEAAVPADDPMLEVFTGPRELQATMPGAGLLEIPGSRIPGEFVAWCRAGGEVMKVEAEEKSDASETPEV